MFTEQELVDIGFGDIAGLRIGHFAPTLAFGVSPIFLVFSIQDSLAKYSEQGLSH
jgi:hypothetical protein